MSRRALVGLVSLIVGLVGAPAAGAAEPDLVTEYEQVTASAQVTWDADGHQVVHDATARAAVVDPAGTILSRRTFDVTATTNTPRDFGFGGPCLADSTNPDMHPQRPVAVKVDERNEKGSFLFHPYHWDNARINNDTEQTFQVLTCAVGGMDAGGGSRLTISGPGMAFNEPDAAYLLARTWKEGQTPENYSLNLGFEVPVRGVTIKGSIQQQPTNSLTGSVQPPFKSDGMSRLHLNAVNAWWEDGCLPYCTRFGGSSHYQGSVGEGLWEFPQTSRQAALARGFSMVGYYKNFCSNPFGC